MLFDEAVVKFVKKHFVCVLADAPWSRIGKRNAKTWEESESWKSYPRSAELVWIVTVDKRDRRGLIYSQFKDPKKLLTQLQVYAREDARLEAPAAQRDRLLVVNRTRARSVPLRRLLQGSQGKVDQRNRRRLMAARNELGGFLNGIPDNKLCPGDAAKLAEQLRNDDKEDRGQLAARLDAMLGLATDLKMTDDVVVGVVRKARQQKHPDFVDVTGLRYAGIVLHARLEQRIAKGGPASAGVAEKLSRLDTKNAKGAGTPIK